METKIIESFITAIGEITIIQNNDSTYTYDIGYRPSYRIFEKKEMLYETLIQHLSATANDLLSTAKTLRDRQ